MNKVEKILVNQFLDLQKKEKVKLIDIITPSEHSRECIYCAYNIL
ncbi:sulfurtransferase, partial [Francisella tularensis subsp. holarctica]|nr:sulfurtransferase [Francisella tularensis subsp. holarctica]